MSLIRFTLDADAAAGPIFVAEGRPHWIGSSDTIMSDPLDAAARAQQARELVDAAALLIEDDESLAGAFERLHEALDLLPTGEANP